MKESRDFGSKQQKNALVEKIFLKTMKALLGATAMNVFSMNRLKRRDEMVKNTPRCLVGMGEDSVTCLRCKLSSGRQTPH